MTHKYIKIEVDPDSQVWLHFKPEGGGGALVNLNNIVLNQTGIIRKTCMTAIQDTLADEISECPTCNKKFKRDFGALSRVDNNVLLCSTCGTQEALGEYDG